MATVGVNGLKMNSAWRHKAHEKVEHKRTLFLLAWPNNYTI